MKTDRFLVVGGGAAGRRHLSLIANLFPEAEVRIWVRSKTSENKDLWNYALTEWTQILEFSPQASVIANPSTLHLEVAMQLASIGSHLLIEKPIAEGVRGVFALRDLCLKKNLVLLIGYNLRYTISLSRFRELVKSAIVGKIFSIRIEVGQHLDQWRPGMDYRKSTTANAKLGGGVLLELSHEIDYLQWIFGDVTSVSGILMTASNLDIDVEDTAHLLLHIKAVDGGNEAVARVDLDMIRQDSKRSCTVIGENGTLVWDAIAGEICLYSNELGLRKIYISSLSEIQDSYQSQLLHFVECVETGVSPQVDVCTAVKTLSILECIRESDRNLGLKIRVPSLDEFGIPN